LNHFRQFDETFDYSSLGLTPELGDNYYRIKQVYSDGTFDYSPVQNIEFNIDSDNLSMYPNPAQNELNLNLEELAGESANIHIINNVGQIVKSIEIDRIESEPIQLSLDNITSVFYQVLIQVDNQQPITKKFIVKKL